MATFEDINTTLSNTLSANTVITTGHTLTATDADSLLIGGVKMPQRIVKTFRLAGAAPQTVANWGNPFFIADRAYQVVTVRERHTTAGTNGSAVSVMLTKAASATAVGTGTACLSAGIDLKATADANQSGSLNSTPGNYQLAAGDSLFAVLTGTPTSLAGVCMTVELEAI